MTKFRKFKVTVKERGKRAVPLVVSYVDKENQGVYRIDDPFVLEVGNEYKLYYGGKLEAMFSPKLRKMYLKISTDNYNCFVMPEEE